MFVRHHRQRMKCNTKGKVFCRRFYFFSQSLYRETISAINLSRDQRTKQIKTLIFISKVCTQFMINQKEYKRSCQIKEAYDQGGSHNFFMFLIALLVVPSKDMFKFLYHLSLRNHRTIKRGPQCSGVCISSKFSLAKAIFEIKFLE